MINDGIFTLDLDPAQLALECYPVLQIALYIYLQGQLPLQVTVAPIVEAAKAVRLLKEGTVFNLFAFFVVHAQASRDHQDYETLPWFMGIW